MTESLARLASSLVLPSFHGAARPPDWLAHRIDAGLAGVVLFARNIAHPAALRGLVRELAADRDDLVIAVDEEGGAVTRLHARTGSPSPGNAALGVVDDPALTRRVYADLGAELTAAGVTLNLAPCADVNTNPRNPVIGVRSFGADPDLVARHAAAAVTGLADVGVAACAKHFPGHGDTAVDSHDTLPTVAAGLDELHRVHLPPFRAAIEADAAAVMTGHLLVPAVDPQTPATFSPRILNGLLRQALRFPGAIITDALDMAAATSTRSLPAAAVAALTAGADALCLGWRDSGPQSLDAVTNAITTAVRDGVLTEEQLEASAARVRRLSQRHPTATHNKVDAQAGAEAARRALRVRDVRPLTVAPLLIELTEHPRGVLEAAPPSLATPLERLLPGVTARRHHPPDDPAVIARICAAAHPRPVVLTSGDGGDPWTAAVLHAVLAARPDTVYVGLSWPRTHTLTTHRIEAYSPSAVTLAAVADVLTGHRR